MRVLLAIVVAAVGAYFAWWWVAAGIFERGVTNWLAGRADAGWVAEAEDITVTGFPNRLDMIVNGLDLASPEGGWAWSAGEFQILTLPYRPNHIIAVLPGEQVLSTPYDTSRFQAEVLRGSVVFEPNTALALDRSSFEIGGMTIAGDAGWEAGIAKANFATRQAEGENARPFAHDVVFTAEDVALPQHWTAGLTGVDLLPRAIEGLRLDLTLDYDRPWDRPAIEDGNPILQGVRVRDASISWGELNLRGQGRLTTDDRGFAEGRIDLRARNWRGMLDIAERSGLIGSGLAGTLRSGLDLVARLSGDRNSLNLPLDFEDGRMRLGPITLGDAPRFTRRF